MEMKDRVLSKEKDTDMAGIIKTETTPEQDFDNSQPQNCPIELNITNDGPTPMPYD